MDKLTEKCIATEVKLNVVVDFLKTKLENIETLIMNELAHRITIKFAVGLSILISLFTAIIGLLVGLRLG